MKVILHIPTEQYGFVAVEVDDVSPDTAAETYRDYAEAFKIKVGLNQKEWNTVLDSYINGNPMNPDTYYAMSPEQQKIIQELKKCFKRLKTSGGREGD